MSKIHKFVLDNGVRILLEPNESVRSAAIGLTCATGSEHEHAGEEGLTHFIEHMLFKGTVKRTAKEIASEIEGRGGVLNAFTDKEQTTYYCRVLSEDIERGIDVLCDMILNSKLDPEELEREKGVVLEEISRSEDEPGDYVHELHITSRWGQHPLGKPVIGTRETVSSFNQDMLRAYLSRRYRANQIVLSVAGFFDVEPVREAIAARLSGLEKGEQDPEITAPIPSPKNEYFGKEVEQVHFCIGGDSVPITDPKIYTAAVLDGVLGGGMSSRLFQEIREKRGLVYSVGSYNLSYRFGGLFTIYGGTGPKTWDQARELIITEIRKVIHDGLEDGELDRIKSQIAGHLVLALEGMYSRMQRMTKNELHFGRDIPTDETLEKIRAVSEKEVRDFAAQHLDPDRLSITTIGPKI